METSLKSGTLKTDEIFSPTDVAFCKNRSLWRHSLFHYASYKSVSCYLLHPPLSPINLLPQFIKHVHNGKPKIFILLAPSLRLNRLYKLMRENNVLANKIPNKCLLKSLKVKIWFVYLLIIQRCEKIGRAFSPGLGAKQNSNFLND